MSDPGLGTLRYNNTTINSVTAIAIDDSTAAASDISGYINTWGDSTAAIKGYLLVKNNLNNSSSNGIFAVNSIVDNAGWVQLNVTYVSGTIHSNAVQLAVQFFRTGDNGAVGATGAIANPLSTIFTITNTTSATSTITGALQVAGGVGIGGDIYAGGMLIGNSSTFIIGVTPDVSQGKAIEIAAGDAPGSATDAGSVTIRGGEGASSSQAGSVSLIGGSVGVGGAGEINITAGNNGVGSGGNINLQPGTGSVNAGQVIINRTTAATSTITGALRVYGGVGIGGSLYVGGEIVAQKLTIQLTTVTTTLIKTDDIIQTTNNTSSTSTSTGALQVAGGVGVGGNIYAGGDLSVVAPAAIVNSRINPRTYTTASITTLTPNISMFDQYNLTAQAEALSVAAPVGTPVDGNRLIFRILDNGTGRALTWNGTYTVIGVTLPTTTTANKTTYVGCIYNANNTRWDVIAVATQA